jgi:pyruvate dehydrogenase E1 component alpha subunit
MNDDLPFNLFKQMFRIRSVEEAIALRYPEGKMRCPVHLSIGQESIPAAFSQVIKANDFAVSTHRGHAHYLAKGGNLNAMIAEIYGKSTGCSGGKGGSMHLIDLGVGFMGTSAIVGNSIPIGVGLGLSSQLQNTSQVSCVFLGDGATEEGVFYESINFSVLKNLPILFICENNLYSVYSPLEARQPKGRSIAKMVSGMGIEVGVEDGSDIFASYELLLNSVNRIRSQNGPIFLEFSTYRWREHCGSDYDNNLGYRTEEEFLFWQEKDPLNILENKLHKKTPNTSGIINSIKKDVLFEIQSAFEFAEKSSFPEQSEAYKGIYA